MGCLPLHQTVLQRKGLLGGQSCSGGGSGEMAPGRPGGRAGPQRPDQATWPPPGRCQGLRGVGEPPWVEQRSTLPRNPPTNAAWKEARQKLPERKELGAPSAATHSKEAPLRQPGGRPGGPLSPHPGAQGSRLWSLLLSTSSEPELPAEQVGGRAQDAAWGGQADGQVAPGGRRSWTTPLGPC